MISVFPLLLLLFLNSSHLEGNMGGVVHPGASSSDTRDPQLFGRRRDDTRGAHTGHQNVLRAPERLSTDPVH